MGTPRIVGFAGSLGEMSRTRSLVTYATRMAAKRFEAEAEVFDIGDLGPEFGRERSFADLTPNSRALFERLISADAIVVGSPVYKGSYSGLFKHAIDLLDPMDLAGKPVLLMASGGGDRHALMVEHQLRPLFAFFEAQVMATAVYASNADYHEGAPSAAPLLARIERGVAQLQPYLSAAK